MDRVEAGEVLLAPIDDAEGAGLELQHVQHGDVMEAAIADVHEGWDGATQVQQRVHLDRGLGGSERRPVEQAQAQVDGGGVQAVNGVVQFHARGQPEVPRVQARAVSSLKCNAGEMVEFEVGEDFCRTGLRCLP